MIDLFGYTPEHPEFKDIRNQRPGVADEKATLCLILNRLCRTVPQCIMAAGIERTRQFMAAREMALKRLKNRRSSVNELTSAINIMREFEE